MFSRTLLLFFVVSVIPKYTSYLTLFRYSTSTRNFLYSRLYNSAATITTESIAPTVYEKDLYSVLGVAKNSSKSELKQAYLQIVFQNHPDRNNSIDALAKFRNATYAYQVLGRDEKSRAIYDRKIDTQTYLTVLEEVGTDIIVPLAREVAVPLINFTFNSISSFAMPILRDVFEQSAAVAQIFAVGVEEDSLEVRMSRALDAFEKTSYDQNMRKLQTQLQQFDETIESTKTRFRDAEQTEKDGIEKQELLLEQFNAESLILDRLISEEALAKSNADSVSAMERSSGEAFRTTRARLDVLDNKQGGLVKDVTSFEGEVTRLEAALAEAKAQLSIKRAELLLVQGEASTLRSSIESKEAEYTAAKELNQANDLMLRNISTTKSKAQSSIRLLTSQLSTINSTVSRDRDFKGHLLKKLTVVSAKRSAALDEIQVLQEDHNAREAAKMEILLRELSQASLNQTIVDLIAPQTVADPLLSYEEQKMVLEDN